MIHTVTLSDLKGHSATESLSSKISHTVVQQLARFKLTLRAGCATAEPLDQHRIVTIV